MNDAFELLDPRNAQAFLKTFEAGARRKGEAHFRKSHVQDLAAEQPGMAYAAEVSDDNESYKVHLHYDPVEGWSGDCSCPQEFDCEHVFAAMRALLAEHSTAAVRSLSAGTSPAAAGWSKSTAKTEQELGSLDRRLKAALGRALKPDEIRFIRKVQSVFTRSRQAGQITHRDFDELGVRLGGY